MNPDHSKHCHCECPDEAIERIRELHKPITQTDDLVFCVGCEQEYPCLTIKALEGEKQMGIENKEFKRWNELGNLLNKAQNSIEMFADIVEIKMGAVDISNRGLIQEIENYRRDHPEMQTYKGER